MTDTVSHPAVTIHLGAVKRPIMRGLAAIMIMIDISGTALRSGQTCLFRLFYADKPGPVIRDIVPDEKKRCTASVTMWSTSICRGAGPAASGTSA